MVSSRGELETENADFQNRLVKPIRHRSTRFSQRPAQRFLDQGQRQLRLHVVGARYRRLAKLFHRPGARGAVGHDVRRRLVCTTATPVQPTGGITIGMEIDLGLSVVFDDNANLQIDTIVSSAATLDFTTPVEINVSVSNPKDYGVGFTYDGPDATRLVLTDPGGRNVTDAYNITFLDPPSGIDANGTAVLRYQLLPKPTTSLGGTIFIDPRVNSAAGGFLEGDVLGNRVTLHGLAVGSAHSPPITTALATPVAPYAGPGARISEGDTFAYTGLFADPSPYAWTATVDYGDSSGTQPLAINPDLTFDLRHIYTVRGTYTITVSLDDGHGGVGSGSAVVNVFGPVVYVDANASGVNSGTTWANACSHLEHALALAEPGQQVWIADGLYKPGTAPGASFALKSGVSVYGGFLGVEQSQSQRDPRANPPVILSGEIGNPGLEDNCCVVTAAGVDASTVLDGLTITAGYNGSGAGGFSCYGSSLTISNCTITGNAGMSGGIYLWGGSPAILNNKIEGNSGSEGGGIMTNESTCRIAGNLISGNHAYFGGGGDLFAQRWGRHY